MKFWSRMDAEAVRKAALEEAAVAAWESGCTEHIVNAIRALIAEPAAFSQEAAEARIVENRRLRGWGSQLGFVSASPSAGTEQATAPKPTD